jgi:hypothetical protein
VACPSPCRHSGTAVRRTQDTNARSHILTGYETRLTTGSWFACRTSEAEGAQRRSVRLYAGDQLLAIQGPLLYALVAVQTQSDGLVRADQVVGIDAHRPRR